MEMGIEMWLILLDMDTIIHNECWRDALVVFVKYGVKLFSVNLEIRDWCQTKRYRKDIGVTRDVIIASQRAEKPLCRMY